MLQLHITTVFEEHRTRVQEYEFPTSSHNCLLHLENKAHFCCKPQADISIRVIGQNCVSPGHSHLQRTRLRWGSACPVMVKICGEEDPGHTGTAKALGGPLLTARHGGVHPGLRKLPALLWGFSLDSPLHLASLAHPCSCLIAQLSAYSAPSPASRTPSPSAHEALVRLWALLEQVLCLSLISQLSGRAAAHTRSLFSHIPCLIHSKCPQNHGC